MGIRAHEWIPVIMDIRDIHTPVMLERCAELLAPALSRDGAVFVDATLGMGGHSEAFLERFPTARLIGLDRDTDALRIAGQRLARFEGRTTFVHTIYDGIAAAVASAGVEKVDGILFDLGVSSLQLDEASRGFAYAQDAPLDMRMDQTSGITAAHVLATYGEGDLRRIFERYGEEKLAARYARAIIAARQQAPLERTGQLVDILQAATPAAVLHERHPAKRVFQALRIEVNAELSTMAKAFPGNTESEPTFVQDDEMFQTAFEIYKAGYPANEFTGLPVAEELMRQFGEQFQSALDGQQSMSDALKKAQDEWASQF